MDIITLSDYAKNKLLELCLLHDKHLIKLSIRKSGCNGNSYHMDFVHNMEKYDEKVLLSDECSLIIDSKAIMMLIGTKLDWEDSGLESKFKFINPNVLSQCGCEKSFNI